MDVDVDDENVDENDKDQVARGGLRGHLFACAYAPSLARARVCVRENVRVRVCVCV